MVSSDFGPQKCLKCCVKREGNLCIVAYVPSVVGCNAYKWSHLLHGHWCRSLKHLTFSGSVGTPRSSMMCPRKIMLQDAEFLGFQLKNSTSKMSEHLTRYIIQVQHQHFPLQIKEHIRCWNIVGALHRPNGITLNSHRPNLVAKAVLSFYASALAYTQTVGLGMRTALLAALHLGCLFTFSQE